MDFNIAIAEDEESAANKLKEMIARYAEEKGYNISVDCFSDGAVFFYNYKAKYDVVFLDIEMPVVNGMDAAKGIRKIDGDVIIVFVTNMAQYAVESYDVRAYDFILKPLNYSAFEMKFDRICNELRHRLDDSLITLVNRNLTRRVRILDITYVEVKNHDLIYHLPDGEFKMRGTMGEIEQKLAEKNFVRCNSCYLVNLKYVTGLSGGWVTVAGEELKISQTRKREFLSEFARYAGGGK